MEDIEIIPPDVKLAAKRGFVRTTAQAYATALSGGISTSIIIGLINGTEELIPFIVAWIVAIVSPIFAGAASYLNIMGAGVPEVYQPTIQIDYVDSYPEDTLTD